MHKIPVFYHIPKNAGTYVIDWLLTGFRHFRTTETFWNKYHVGDKAIIKTIQIKSNTLILAKLLVGDPKHFIDTCSHVQKITKNDFIIDFNEEFITKILQECFLFTVVIESSGFTCRETILKLVRDDHELHQFLILRDPFERCQSEFNYLTSEASKHEPTHGRLNQKNFEEYIFSCQLSDSWVIRTLLNIQDKDPITKIHFNEIIGLFTRESFFVYTMKNVDESIKDALKNSYNIEIKDITLGPYDQIERNKNEYKKITFLSLSEKAQEKFLEITYWDRELYYYYNQSSSPGLNFFI